jgi:ubiquinone biosynthesis monooxygenase Coq7
VPLPTLIRDNRPLDHWLGELQGALNTVFARPEAQRANPGEAHAEAELDQAARRHAAGLMRINHTGEVCAQALYQGQALTAREAGVRGDMQQAAGEEIDHLAWCEERVAELGSHTSHLNPLFYAMSFGMGALAGALGDRWSLGFVAATEEQVCQHLREHLERLPAEDTRSRAILQKMIEDEERHGRQALEAGGTDLPPQVKEVMRLMSRLMTGSTYRI